jgi:exopolysaccharide biosynthesis polyprenyl glycosylphosphotransferase
METPIDVKLLPDITDLVTRKLELSRLGGMPVLTLMGDPIGPANRLAKRMMDVVIGSVGAVLVAIPSLIAALLIKLDSRGPVLFVQKRVGQDGRVFNCYKFRTMISGAGPERHKRFMEKVIARANSPEADGSGEKELYKEKDDPRITRMGRFLRRYSLDEVPQIINVLRGEMSLVGPRPPIPYEVREYEDWHRGRLAIRPGITGLWQVSGRNKISFEGMVRLDIFYIENYSLWLDLKILLQTIPAVLRGTGY